MAWLLANWPSTPWPIGRVGSARSPAGLRWTLCPCHGVAASWLGIGELAAVLLANCASAATTPCASRLASVVIVLPRHAGWGRGKELLQGGEVGEPAAVSVVHGPGGGGAGGAAPALRGDGVAVRGAPKRRVPDAAGGEGFHGIPVPRLGGGGVSDPGAGAGARCASGRACCQPGPGAGAPRVLLVAGAARRGGAAVRGRRGAGPGHPGAARERAGGSGAAALRANDAALVRRGPVARLRRGVREGRAEPPPGG